MIEGEKKEETGVLMTRIGWKVLLKSAKGRMDCGKKVQPVPESEKTTRKKTVLGQRGVG